MKTINLTQEQFDFIQTHLTLLKMSCREGYDMTWDSGSDEGRESFLPMIDFIETIGSTLGMRLDESEI